MKALIHIGILVLGIVAGGFLVWVMVGDESDPGIQPSQDAGQLAPEQSIDLDIDYDEIYQALKDETQETDKPHWFDQELEHVESRVEATKQEFQQQGDAAKSVFDTFKE